MTESDRGAQAPSPQHVEPPPIGVARPATSNPVVRGLNVMVSIPESVEVRMVDASVLGDYEVWIFIASLVSNLGVGFLVAYLQEDAHDSALLVNSIFFIVMFGMCLGMALRKRHRLRAKSRQISLRATDADF